MTPNTTTRCTICGREILRGQPYGFSKPKGCRTLFHHEACIKYRKERKK